MEGGDRSAASGALRETGQGGSRALAWFGVSLLAATIVGAGLRLYQIQDQVSADDEWHTVYAALRRGCALIATHFGIADYCIPMALFDRAVSSSSA